MWLVPRTTRRVRAALDARIGDGPLVGMIDLMSCCYCRWVHRVRFEGFDPASRDVSPGRRRWRHRGREPHRGHGSHARADRDQKTDPLDDVGRHDGPRPRLRLEGGPGAPGPPRARGLHDPPTGGPARQGGRNHRPLPGGCDRPPAGRTPAVPARGRPAGPTHPRASPGPLDPRHAVRRDRMGITRPTQSSRGRVRGGAGSLPGEGSCSRLGDASGRDRPPKRLAAERRVDARNRSRGPRTRRTDRRRGPATVRA